MLRRILRTYARIERHNSRYVACRFPFARASHIADVHVRCPGGVAIPLIVRIRAQTFRWPGQRSVSFAHFHAVRLIVSKTAVTNLVGCETTARSIVCGAVLKITKFVVAFVTVPLTSTSANARVLRRITGTIRVIYACVIAPIARKLVFARLIAAEVWTVSVTPPIARVPLATDLITSIVALLFRAIVVTTLGIWCGCGHGEKVTKAGCGHQKNEQNKDD